MGWYLYDLVDALVEVAAGGRVDVSNGELQIYFGFQFPVPSLNHLIVQLRRERERVC